MDASLLGKKNRSQVFTCRTAHLQKCSLDDSANVLSPLGDVGVVVVQVRGKRQELRLEIFWKETESIRIRNSKIFE